MSLLRQITSRLYAKSPKRLQYAITEGKRSLRRLTVEPRLIREAQARIARQKEALAGRESLSVVFLAVYDSMWKYDALFAAMRQHPRIRPTLVVCPADNLPVNEREALLQKTLSHFRSKGFDPVSACQADGEIRDIRTDFAPDFIFYTTPYDIQLPPALRQRAFPDVLSCYALYGYPLEEYPDWYDLLFHNLLSYYFLVSEEDLRIYSRLSRLRGSNGVVSGAPLFDAFRQAMDRQDRLEDDGLPLVIIAPHHSIEPWGYSLSNFLDYADAFLQLAQQYEGRLRFAFKPHPILKTKLYNLDSWGRERTDRYYQAWNEMPHTELSEGAYIELFCRSAALVHDCSAFTVEYQITGRPALFMRKNGRLPHGLNRAAQEAFALHTLADSIFDVDAFLQGIASHRPDPLAERRQAFIHDYLLPADGRTASATIIETLLSHCSPSRE